MILYEHGNLNYKNVSKYVRYIEYYVDTVWTDRSQYLTTSKTS